MQNILKSITPTDIIAIITIIGGLILKFNGADGVVSSLMIMIVAYYFGKKGVEMATKKESGENSDKL